MFRQAVAQNTRRARPQVGQLVPFGVPFKGINAQATFANMGSEYALSLRNVLVNAYGMETRAGYTEWATEIPGDELPVLTVLHYYPASAGGLTSFGFVPGSKIDPHRIGMHRIEAYSGPTPGKIFAAKGGFLYDVTIGGDGPWTAEVDVEGDSDYWSFVNFQNTAGSFLLTCNEEGGYAIYDGTNWTMPVEGAGVGEIENVNPELLVFVTTFKNRVWFIEQDSTSAWYLDTEAITGPATEFDFGPLLAHGGYLAVLATWTIDGGAGIDDHLIGIGNQGDVIIYKGTDPSDAANFQLVGVWYVGPLPNGRRCVEQDGYDVNILSQLGVTRISQVLESNSASALIDNAVTKLIAPIIGRLMQTYANLEGWQVKTIAKDELILVGLPYGAPNSEGEFFALKLTTNGWSIIDSVPYVCFDTVGNVTYAGTDDGRVVRAFNGSLDNVPFEGSFTGDSIHCRVVPGYSYLGAPGLHKNITMFRPSFTSSYVPGLSFVILTDFGPALPLSTPTVPTSVLPGWDEAIWDVDLWSGGLQPIAKWFGATGEGFAATVQLEYNAVGGTLLTAMDFFVQQGGIL
jgi:hypothetical protein